MGRRPALRWADELWTHMQRLVVALSSDYLTFTWGRLLVLVTNAGAGRSVSLCVTRARLRGPSWSDVCSGEATGARVVMRGALDPESAEEGKLRMQSEDGQLSVFARRSFELGMLV